MGSDILTGIPGTPANGVASRGLDPRGTGAVLLPPPHFLNFLLLSPGHGSLPLIDAMSYCPTRAETPEGAFSGKPRPYYRSWRMTATSDRRRPFHGRTQGAGSIPILSFTAEAILCVHPRY